MAIWDFFGNKDQEKETEIKNAERIQDFINKFDFESRDLKSPQQKEDSRDTTAWQGYDWIKKALETSSSRSIKMKDYREMVNKTPEIAQSLRIYCLHPDTVISTLKGNYTIKELSNGVLGNEFEVWSYNLEENKVDIGKATNPHKTLTKADVYKVTFNNGDSIIATSNHPFLLKTKEYKKLENLVPGDRIVPFHLSGKERPSLSTLKYGYTGCHQYVWFLNTGEWVKRPYVIHHKDSNKFNNSFKNLQKLINEEHTKLHMSDDKRIKKIIESTQKKERNKKISKSWTIERKKNFGNYIRELYKSNPEYKKRTARHGEKNGRYIGDIDLNYLYEHSKNFRNFYDYCNSLPYDSQVIYGRLQQLGFTGWQQLREHHTVNILSDNLDEKNLTKISRKTPYSSSYLHQIVYKLGYKNWDDMRSNYENHEVVSIEYYGKSDVYDMEVENFHNFNANGVFVHNSDNGTQYNVNNRVLEIESPNNKIIEILNKMFFENLDMNADLWKAFYNMCKLGDEFYEVILDNVDKPHHIISIERIKKPENMERVEKNGKLEKFVYNYNDKDKEAREFQPWQIIHFRIEDEETDPYGKSILESGRDIFKKLALMEDAMLVYRISRAPERRVFYIDVGTLSTKQANQYINQVKRQFRKKKFIDPQNGQVQEKANPMCLTLDTKIPLLDNRTLTIEELIEEYNHGKTNWVYSIDTENNNQIIPGKINWAGKTRENAELVEVILDNDEKLKTTPDHKFMLRDGSYKEAKDLKENDSLMPLYRKLSDKNDSIKGYEMVMNPANNKYEYTHHISDFMRDNEINNVKKCGRFVRHHIDFNKVAEAVLESNTKSEAAKFLDCSCKKVTNKLNHKVKSIEFLNEREDTADITIEKYHNFATNSGVFVHNSTTEDFFIGVRQGSNGTRIETLPAGQQLGEVRDVDYFKNRILKTLGVPVGYLGGQTEGGATYDPKSYLSNQEIQFARTVERIQKFIIKGLEKAALIELALSDIPVKDIRKFKIKLTPPSNVDQLMEIEIRNQQFSLIQNIKSIENFLPDEWIYKNVLGLSEQEINNIKLQIQMQMQMQMQTQQGAEGGMEMGGGNIAGGAAPGVAGGGGIGPEVGAEGGGEEAGAEAGGEGAGLEVAGQEYVEFDGGKWLLENMEDVKKLLKYVKLYEKVHKDNKKNKDNLYENSLTRMTTKGEFRGILKLVQDSSLKRATLNEMKIETTKHLNTSN